MTPSASPRHVFVTGSTRGIGHAIAAAFVEADYTQRASARMVLDALDALG